MAKEQFMFDLKIEEIVAVRRFHKFIVMQK